MFYIAIRRRKWHLIFNPSFPLAKFERALVDCQFLQWGRQSRTRAGCLIGKLRQPVYIVARPFGSLNQRCVINVKGTSTKSFRELWYVCEARFEKEQNPDCPTSSRNPCPSRTLWPAFAAFWGGRWSSGIILIYFILYSQSLAMEESHVQHSRNIKSTTNLEKEKGWKSKRGCLFYAMASSSL